MFHLLGIVDLFVLVHKGIYFMVMVGSLPVGR